VTLDDAIDKIDQSLPTDWRVVSIDKVGVQWQVTIAHQLTGEERVATSWKAETAASKAAEGLATFRD
jgi:hypothetical protein